MTKIKEIPVMATNIVVTINSFQIGQEQPLTASYILYGNEINGFAGFALKQGTVNIPKEMGNDATKIEDFVIKELGTTRDIISTVKESAPKV